MGSSTKVRQSSESFMTQGSFLVVRLSPFAKLPGTTVSGLILSGLSTKCIYMHSKSPHPTILIFVLTLTLVITNNLEVFKA